MNESNDKQARFLKEMAEYGEPMAAYFIRQRRNLATTAIEGANKQSPEISQSSVKGQSPDGEDFSNEIFIL